MIGSFAKPRTVLVWTISAPSRSGTTHLTVETILQGEGWQKGWATLLEIGGNLAQVSDRSFGVPDAVNSGQYGIGIVIDFFGLSAKASGFPVEFVYPTITTIVPANVGIIANARNQRAAEAFVEFLLSEDGQQLLLDHLREVEIEVILGDPTRAVGAGVLERMPDIDERPERITVAGGGR